MGDWIANAHRALIDVGEERPSVHAEEPSPELAADEETRWALANGVDKLVHPLNLLRHLLGERYRLVFVHVTGRLLAFESESGVPATIEVAPYRSTVGLDEEILVAFERGYVRLRPAPSLAVNRAGTLEIYRDPGGGVSPERIRPQLPWVDPMQAQAADFLLVCRGEAAPPTDAAERQRICTSYPRSYAPASGFRAPSRRFAPNAASKHSSGRSSCARWRTGGSTPARERARPPPCVRGATRR